MASNSCAQGCLRGRPAAAKLPVLTDELCAREWDAVVIGSGVGGLTTATEMARKGAKVLVLESYIIPGGSAGKPFSQYSDAVCACLVVLPTYRALSSCSSYLFAVQTSDALRV